MSDTLLRRIRKCDFTKGQAKIADYILKNQKRILKMTSMQIAKEIGVSDASIIRFSRVIGFQGFSEMKEYIAQKLEEEKEDLSKEDLQTRFEIRKARYDSDHPDLTEMLKLMGGNLESSLRQNPMTAYMRVADMLLGAKTKVIIGLRGGKGCAIQFERLLKHILPSVWSMTSESQDQLCELQKLTSEDMVIFLNYQRYYKIDAKIAEILHEYQIPYCLITDSTLSPAVKYAKEVLLVETDYYGFFHSMLAPTGILEYLLICMCWKHPELVKERLKEREKILGDELL